MRHGERSASQRRRWGSLLPISVKISTTPSPVFADVSKNSRPASDAYASASSLGTCLRLSGSPEAAVSPGVAVASSASSSDSGAVDEEADGVTRSILLPARAMTMFGLACRWSSFTHVFAFSRLEAFVTS